MAGKEAFFFFSRGGDSSDIAGKEKISLHRGERVTTEPMVGGKS